MTIPKKIRQSEQKMLDIQAARLSKLLGGTRVWVGHERGGWTVFIGVDFLYPGARSFNITHDKLTFACSVLDYAARAKHREQSQQEET